MMMMMMMMITTSMVTGVYTLIDWAADWAIFTLVDFLPNRRLRLVQEKKNCLGKKFYLGSYFWCKRPLVR